MDTTTIYIIGGSVGGFVLILLCVCCCLGLCGFSVAYRKKANERARAAAAAARRKRAKKAASAATTQQQQSLQMVPYVHAAPHQSAYAIPPPIVYPQVYPPSHTVIYPPQHPAYYPQPNHNMPYPQDTSGQGQPSVMYPMAMGVSPSIAPPILPGSVAHAGDVSRNNSSEASLTAELANSINRLTKYLEREVDESVREADDSEECYSRRGSTPNNVYLNNNQSSSHSILTKPSMMGYANGDALIKPCDDIGDSDHTQDIDGGISNLEISQSPPHAYHDPKTETTDNKATEEDSSPKAEQSSAPAKVKQYSDQRSVVTTATLKSFSVVIGQLGEHDIIDVTTSPGVLGIVLDASDEGWPIIRKVKMDSVLLDQVSVGDRVMSVDGKDARNMTIGEVSGLLNKFSGESRIVTVLRKESTGVDS
eukprot:CCRYP_010239-RB/>CCRYP_010239-RB protein AED:0.22 eAED:0.22 QI:224/1/1/1/0.5/0.33/3/1498/420